MNLKRLGKTEVFVPEIGLGTWNYEGGVEPLRAGIELGASLIDTAEGYYTEDIVGEAVLPFRDEVIIATKVSGRNLAHDSVLRSCEASLEKLRTDCIDLYQIHWPNPAYPIDATMRALEKLVDRGCVSYVGVSNFSVRQMREAQHCFPNYPIVSNQVLYNLRSRDIEKELLPYCQNNDITVMAYTPLDAGRLCRTRRGGILGVLSQIAVETGKTEAQVALNWCVCQENVIVIPKADSVARTVENCGASGWRLSPEQLSRLDDAF
ncbi:MAG: aldo/keto reductase [Candidatus Dadabacteria bacterium]|nr:aldo/keto reductase [Candidatus Dadabacteria bacterium]